MIVPDFCVSIRLTFLCSSTTLFSRFSIHEHPLSQHSVLQFHPLCRSAVGSKPQHALASWLLTPMRECQIVLFIWICSQFGMVFHLGVHKQKGAISAHFCTSFSLPRGSYDSTIVPSYDSQTSVASHFSGIPVEFLTTNLLAPQIPVFAFSCFSVANTTFLVINFHILWLFCFLCLV